MNDHSKNHAPIDNAAPQEQSADPFSTPETGTLNEFHLEFINQLPGMALLRDTECRCLWANEFTARSLGFANQAAVIGRTPFDLPCPAAICAASFVEQAHYVITHKKALYMLEILNLSQGERRILWTSEQPILHHNTVLGGLRHAIDLTHFPMAKVSDWLLKSEQYYTPQRADTRSYTVNGSPKDHGLTPRELDCLFYVLRGQTNKEVGRSLGISCRTVDKYLQNIKYKWHCPNKKNVIDRAIQEGLLDYLPTHIVWDGQSHSLPIHLSGG